MANAIMDMKRVIRDLPADAKAALKQCRSKKDLKAVFEKHVIAKSGSGEGKGSDEWRVNAVRAFFHEKPAPKPEAVEAPKTQPVSLRDQPRPTPAAPVNAKKIVTIGGKTPGTAWAPPPPEQGTPKFSGTAWRKTGKAKVEEPPVIEEDDLLAPEDLTEE